MSNEKAVVVWSILSPTVAEVGQRHEEEGRPPRYWCRNAIDTAVVELFVQHYGGFNGTDSVVLYRDVDHPRVEVLTTEMQHECLWAYCRPPTNVLDQEGNSELESKYKLVTEQLASEKNRIQQLERSITGLVVERHELKQMNTESVIKWCDENKDQIVRDLSQSMPGDLRDNGWMVAVHNDYKQDGRPHTFWLLVRDGRAVKGEGPTDSHALNQIRKAIGGDK